MSQHPEADERKPGFSGLTNIDGLPTGGLSINDSTIAPIEYSMVGIQANQLSGVAPLPAYESNTCTLTLERNTTGYNAGRLPEVEPFVTTAATNVAVRVLTNELQFKLTKQERQKLDQLSQKQIRELPRAQFSGVEFFLYDDEIEQEAVVEVTSADLEGPNTVNDPRFGSISGDTACASCQNTVSNCPGHQGFIRLNAPYSPEFFQRFIVKVLRSICIWCNKSILSEKQLGSHGFWSYKDNDPTQPKIWRYYEASRLDRISELVASTAKKTGISCTRNKDVADRPCFPNPKYKYDKDTKQIQYRLPNDNRWKILLLEQIRAIFDQIPPEEASLLGFKNQAHPRRLIFTRLVVPPLSCRPPTIRDGQVVPDNITKEYRSIVQENLKIKPAKQISVGLDVKNKNPFPMFDVPRDKDRDGTINRVRTFINRLIFGSTSANERYISVKKLLQGKKGLFRRFMMGKRGDYTARTVLTPGPELEYGEIGLPRSWAKILTYPVEITAENSQALTALIRAGKVAAIRLKRKEGHKIRVNPDKLPDYELQPGDIVERHLQDGDYVAFNRNPSWHKFSIMGYQVRLVDGLTIRLNIGTTPHHNADFDGDEGNVYMPRSPEAIAELKTIMNARYCIISGQDNRPLTGLVFNDLTAAYKLTRNTTIVHETTWQECMDILSRNGTPDQLAGDSLIDRMNKYKLHERSGAGLFSALLPKDFYYKKGKVVIVEGILTNGPVSREQGGATHRSIVQFLVKNYSAERAAQFLSDSQFVLKRWLEDDPVTTSLADCYPKTDPNLEVLPLYELINNQEKLALVDLDLCLTFMQHYPSVTNYETVLERSIDKYDNIRDDVGVYLISGLFPVDFNLTVDNEIIVQDGIFLADLEVIVDDEELKQQIRAKTRKIRAAIIRALAEKYSDRRSLAFIRDLNKLLTSCLGLSLESGKHYELIEQEIERAKTILEKYGPQLRDPKKKKRAEEFIINQLSRVKIVGEKTLAENLAPDNNLSLIISDAKTKGGPENIAQIAVIIGPQFKGASLMASGNDTIYQDTDDMDPLGFGVIFSNFLKGIGVEEFLYHAMAGREGMVDTSIKTSIPGTLSRQLIKNLESVMVLKDGSIRLTNGQIIQPYYGYTTFDPEKLINVSFPEGDMPFFIDIESVANTLNIRHGKFESEPFVKLV